MKLTLPLIASVFLACAGSLLAAAPTAVQPTLVAAPQSTFYSDRPTFLAHATGTTTLGFEGIAPATGNGFYPVPPGVTLSGVNFSVDTANFPVTFPYMVITSTNPGDYYPGNAVLSEQATYPGATGNLHITFSHPVTAIGLDIGDNFAGATTATFRLSDGETFTRTPGNGTHFFGTSPGPDFRFVGLTSTTPITYMDIQEPADNAAANAVINVDNFTFGTASSTPVPPRADIAGFTDPGGFTLNGNTGGYDGQDATAHGVPTLSGNSVHLTTTKGVPDTVVYNGITYNTFFGAENTTVFANQQHYIGSFYASFTYRYGGTNPLSFGPGNGFGFILQNDPRGLNALGTSGYGNGRVNDGGTISPSATVEFGLFTGFGQPRGTQLAFNGDPGINGPMQVPGSVNLISGDPISVILSYDGATLSETLTDTLAHAAYSTHYAADLPAALGGTYAYVGFCGGTGAAVSDQTVSNFLYSTTAPVAPPVNNGPKITVTAFASVPLDTAGTRHILINLTNSGGMSADQLQVTGVLLNGSTPIPPPIGDIHNVLPTIPNLLTPGVTQVAEFVYTVPTGLTRVPLKVSGTYLDPVTHGTATFSATIRSLSLP